MKIIRHSLLPAADPSLLSPLSGVVVEQSAARFSTQELDNFLAAGGEEPTDFPLLSPPLLRWEGITQSSPTSASPAVRLPSTPLPSPTLPVLSGEEVEGVLGSECFPPSLDPPFVPVGEVDLVAGSLLGFSAFQLLEAFNKEWSTFVNKYRGKFSMVQLRTVYSLRQRARRRSSKGEPRRSPKRLRVYIGVRRAKNGGVSFSSPKREERGD